MGVVLAAGQEMREEVVLKGGHVYEFGVEAGNV